MRRFGETLDVKTSLAAFREAFNVARFAGTFWSSLHLAGAWKAFAAAFKEGPNRYFRPFLPERTLEHNTGMPGLKSSIQRWHIGFWDVAIATSVFVTIASLIPIGVLWKEADSYQREISTTQNTTRGVIDKVVNARTMVLSITNTGKVPVRIHLSGVNPGPPEALANFKEWIDHAGSVTCHQQNTGNYVCFTDKGIDIGEVALLEGAGTATPKAPLSYKKAEEEARLMVRGLWALQPPEYQ